MLSLAYLGVLFLTAQPPSSTFSLFNVHMVMTHAARLSPSTVCRARYQHYRHQRSPIGGRSLCPTLQTSRGFWDLRAGSLSIEYPRGNERGMANDGVDQEIDSTSDRVRADSRSLSNSIVISAFSHASNIVVKVFKAASKTINVVARGTSNDDPLSLLETLKRIFDTFLSVGDGSMSYSNAVMGSLYRGGAHKASASDDVDNSGELEKGLRESLAKEFGIEDVDSALPSTVVIGGTLPEALNRAKQQARLLVILITNNNKTRRGSSTGSDSVDDNVRVMTSFLSPDVAQIAEGRARRNKKAALLDKGSFCLWNAKYGSPEATTALQRIKGVQLMAKKNQKPILLVVYPSSAMTERGQVVTVPRLLAQHHCNPPLTPARMADWLNELRKRHVKQYVVLQKLVQEAEWDKERTASYQGSVVADTAKAEQQRRQEEERQRLEQEERDRAEYVKRRRQELLDALPDEYPASSSNGGSAPTTIALRFLADGRTAKRRFAPDALVHDVFNWIDAMYEMDRESFSLQTMNGQQTLTYDDTTPETTLQDVGLRNMVGLRVLTKTSTSTTAKPSKTDDGDTTS